MQGSFKTLLCCAAIYTAMLSLAPMALSQDSGALQPLPIDVNVQKLTIHNFGLTSRGNAAASQLTGAATLPLTNFSVVASDGNTYTGTLVGTSPFDGSGLTTMVNTPIIPVVIQVNLGGNPYASDPTASDPCLPSGADTDLVVGSPLFDSTTDYIINGQDVGATQYVDAVERASFWSLVSGTNYHVLLQPMVTASQTFNTFTQGFYDPNPSCGGNTFNLFFEINQFDHWVTTVALPAAGIDPTEFPVLLLQNVSFYDGVIQNCCIAGYHGAVGAMQTYSPSNVDTANYFLNDSDVATLSHEIAEWVNDPLANNATPRWGHVGQVSGCQANLEVGDPLSGTLFPTVTLNGFDYHMQELTFFDWFFGTPAEGAGGLYSNNGTFTAPAAPCP